MESESQLLHEAQAAIQALPGLVVRTAQREKDVGGVRLDLDLVIEVQGRPARILVEAKRSGYPRDLREAVWQLKRLSTGNEALPGVPFVVAPAISPGGRELLRQEHIGYWDAGGSLFLELPWAVYYVDRPVPKLDERRRRAIYRGRAAQVLHMLLLEPDHSWHVHDLAARAEVSPYTAHQVLNYLEEQLWVEKRGAGPQSVRTLLEPASLLDAWAAAHSLDEYRFLRYHRWAQSPVQLRRTLAEALDQAEIPYALTLGSGAELVAPFATAVDRLSLLVSSDAQIEPIAQAAGLQAVDEGENIVFLVTRDHSPLMFRQRVDDLWVASSVQLYLDLSAWPMRGKELARHLRAERLSY